MRYFATLLTTFGLILMTPETRACSAFASSSAAHRLMGKSYDWYMNHGLAYINKRNVRKTSLVQGNDIPVTWVSKYGSLTYTQFGRDFPISGINEKGLAVEILWDFDYAEPPQITGKAALNEVQWIQYQLDNSATVNEAMANSEKVQMRKLHAPIHYFVCDVVGDCAAFEFTNQGMRISRANGAPTLTNSSYPLSVNYLKFYEGFGGNKEIPMGSYNSKDRFVVLNAQLTDLNRLGDLKSAIDKGFGLLASVRKPGYTVWQMMHDLNSQTSYFRRMFDESVTRIIDLKRFDLSCATPAQVLDLESEDQGDASAEFIDYDPALNRSTAELAGQGLGMDKAVIEAVATYPDSTVCEAP